MARQLLALVVALLVIAAALVVIGATPVVPSGVPSAGGVAATLGRSDLPIETVGYILVDAAWLIWGWLTITLILRVVIDLADGAFHGAGWVRELRDVSDRVTLPLVRRAVDGALAAVILANVAVRAVPVAAAEPLVAEPVSIVSASTAAATEAVAPQPRRQDHATHVVRAGETLWSIAEEYYGSGREYPRVVDANIGRSMGGGQTFTRTGVIQPGWSLNIPLPSTNVEKIDGEYFYTVQPGDTLWGISGRMLGDESRWPELFDANREAAHMADGRVLSDPDLIWPELKLRLPPPVVGLQDEIPATPDVDAAPAQRSAPQPAPTAPVDMQEPSGVSAEAIGMGGAAAAVALAAVGGGLALARRRGRRDLLELPLDGEPQTDTPIRGGFAEIDPARKRPPAIDLAAQVERTLGEQPGSIAMLKYGRAHSTIVVQAPTDAHQAIRGLAGALAARLGVRVDARSVDGDVVFEIVARGAPIPSVDAPGTSPLALSCVLTDRRELWLNLDVAGHVLVASQPGGDADVVATSVLLTLAARLGADALKVWTIGTAGDLPPVLDGLPQIHKARADSANALELEAALRDVRAELIRRMQQPVPGDRTEIVLMIGELTDVDYRAHRTTLDMLCTYGPAHGVRIIAATRQSPQVPDAFLAGFSTRLVLRTASAEESQRLVGRTDAADLLGGGQLCARVGQRRPEEGYGVRVRPDLLERFVRLLRAQHRLPPLASQPTPPTRGAAHPQVSQLAAIDPATDSEVIHVRCFGGFATHGPSGELIPTPDELPQTHAWDVLAALASAPEGSLGTGELLERIWPGAERASAEAWLRSSLTALQTMLRRVMPSLSSEAVRFAAGDICHLDTRLVISDVHRFLRLCRAAPHMPPEQSREAWQRARGLYRGELLDGPGARGWTWSEQLRERYREHAYQATVALARLAVADGRLHDAVSFYQELLSVEPTLEDVVRELCECYLQIGDTEAIQDLEVNLKAALHAAYLQAGPDENPLAYEPEAATLALFERAQKKAPALVAD